MHLQALVQSETFSPRAEFHRKDPSMRRIIFGLSFASLFFLSANAQALDHYHGLMGRAFIKSSSINPESEADFRITSEQQQNQLGAFCKKLGQQFKKQGWESDPCGSLKWQATLQSADKNPLLFMSFGKGTQTTLLLSGVHPDELTPIPMGFRLARYLSENPQLVKEDQQIIIAPLVNPDGYLRQGAPTRTNMRGVDPNRNFFTLDWYEKSLATWQHARNRSLPHFPGHFPNSEIETIFQVRLIDEFQPDKILSIHAPLGFLDYDGPGDQKPSKLSPTEAKARALAEAISKKSKNYRVVDYSFYPGSLGNFAGNERHIPTVTLELRTTDAHKVDEYWEQFLPGILQAINYPFKKEIEESRNTQKFYSHYEEFVLRSKDKS